MPSYYFSPEIQVKDGKPRFVRSRSFSHPFRNIGEHLDERVDHIKDHIEDPFVHHHHHHKHRRHHHHHHHKRRPACPEFCAGVTVDEWNNLVAREKDTAAQNAVLTAENVSLKADLQTANTENAALRADYRQIYDENKQLRHSLYHDGEAGDKFRRRIAALRADLDKKDDLLRKLEADKDCLARTLEKENGRLISQIGDLNRSLDDSNKKVSDLKSSLTSWQDRSEELQRIAQDFERRYDRAQKLLDQRTAELERKMDVIDRQRHRITHLDDDLHHDHLHLHRGHYNYVYN